MKLILISLVIISLKLKCVYCVQSSRNTDGYPVGMLTDCPGSTKEVKLSQRSLKRLYFLHLPKGLLPSNVKSYNYYQMDKLAKQLDFTKKTVLYMNGYMDSSYLNVVTPAMGSVYTDKGYNVLLVEYIQLTSYSYPKASRILPAVGRRAAEMLAVLIEHGLKLKDLEVAGISFGAQGISFIGKHFRKITGHNITRITALDPAGPCFRRLGPEGRIDASDADFVDIIHTNIDGYGFASAVGHVDFYINGGEYQPPELPVFPCGGMCSHLRSYTVWVAAMNYPNSFIGVKCDSIQDARDKNCFKKPLITNVIGDNIDRNVHGIFYVPTTNLYPYFLGKKGLDPENDISDNYIKKMNEVDLLII